MTSTTHQRAGLVIGLMTQHLFIAPLYKQANAASQLFMITLYCIATIIGSTLPDIDLKTLKLESISLYIHLYLHTLQTSNPNP